MNRLDPDRRRQVISALVEGNSLQHSTSGTVSVAINTVVKLAVDGGAACADYQDRVMRGLRGQRLQVDEVWSFCYAKAKNVRPEIAAKNPGAGDTWTFTAIDADSKLIPCWQIGPRDAVTAQIFLNDLAGRLTNPRFNSRRTWHSMYVQAVRHVPFMNRVDYAQLVI